MARQQIIEPHHAVGNGAFPPAHAPDPEVIFLSDILRIAGASVQWALNVALIVLLATRPWAG